MCWAKEGGTETGEEMGSAEVELRHVLAQGKKNCYLLGEIGWKKRGGTSDSRGKKMKKILVAPYVFRETHDRSCGVHQREKIRGIWKAAEWGSIILFALGTTRN